MTSTPVLNRSVRDWVATGTIAVVAAAAVVLSVVGADIRHAHLEQLNVPGEESTVTVLGTPPTGVEELFRVDNLGVSGQYKPLIAHGLLITNDSHEVTAYQPDGEVAWTYKRDNAEICSLASAWDDVIITFRTGRGCGDVVSINAATGTYAATRSAQNSTNVAAVSSNDRVGTLSTQRVELWRSDLVRTVEYGDVEAKQEPNMQPHEECTINSALTRKELLVVSETCPDSAHTNWLRFQKTTPEDSRKPEITKDIAIDGDGARLISVGQTAAAIYIPGTQPVIVSYDDAGNEVARTEVSASPAVANSASPFSPATADLPNHMTWFDGETLYFFTPTAQRVDRMMKDAIGTPIATGQRALIPTKEGIAVMDWLTGSVEEIIPVDRGDYSGPIYLAISESTIFEARGNAIVALKATTD
ncbi:MAG: hypothetical protein SOW59_04980 [Corynebacterium sp.]|nr:hypothetical protein [Corynebacterium sp.]